MKPPIDSSTTVAPAVARVTDVPFARITWVPSTAFSSSVSFPAIRSMMFSSRACWAEMLTASVTKLAASWALRPRCSARLVIDAAASFTAFSEPIAPFRPTGVAAPTFVPGAMAATGVDIRTYAPAEAARAPCGAT